SAVAGTNGSARCMVWGAREEAFSSGEAGAPGVASGTAAPAAVAPAAVAPGATPGAVGRLDLSRCLAQAGQGLRQRVGHGNLACLAVLAALDLDHAVLQASVADRHSQRHADQFPVGEHAARAKVAVVQDGV